MIKELLTYCLESPSLKEAKNFGHLKESISLLSREARCKNAWLPHRTQCKNFILASVKNALHYDSILILGSGPLHEIPIAELCSTFKKVICVDIVHLNSTKKTVAHLRNIEFIEHDISELEKPLTSGSLEAMVPNRFLNKDWGLVLSVNLMSQLPLHLERYIYGNLKGRFEEIHIEQYLKQVTLNHLNYLLLFQCPVALLTDVEIKYYDRNDQLIESHSHMDHINFPKPKEEWLWSLAPIPEYDKNVSLKLKVQAFLLNQRNQSKK